MVGRRIEMRPGDVFGSLTVIEEDTPKISPGGKVMRFFVCRCICGRVVRVSLRSVLKSTDKKCRCARYRPHGKRLLIKYNGEELTAKEWATRLGISVNTILTRMYHGDRSVEEILGIKYIESRRTPLAVLKIDAETGVVLGTYPTAKAAAEENGINFAGIGRCLRGEQDKYKGFVWKRANRE